MIYEAKVVKIKYMEDYEGSIHININNILLFVCYLAPYDFVKEYLCINTTIPIDFWLFYGTAKKNNIPLKYFPDNLAIAGGIIKGQITKVFSSHEFRIDCGPLEIDILNETSIELSVGEYIEIEGTYQIFFPGTDYTKEATWD